MTNKDNTILLSVTCLGISALICQIVMVREFLNLFTGNELVLGLVLGNWLFLTGAGTYLGRFAVKFRRPQHLLFLLQISIALLPLLLLFAIRLLKQYYGSGMLLSLQDAFPAFFLILAPYCLLSGFLLPFFAVIAGRGEDSAQIGIIYTLDVLGDIIGGLLFSFVLIYFFEPTEILFFLLVINLMAALLVSWFWLARPYVFFSLLLIVTSLLIFSAVNLELLTTRMMFPGQNLLLHETTPYGNLVITESDRQITVYENGVVTGSTGDPGQAEEIVHFGLAQHPAPRDILVISGGLSGSLAEVLKYPVRTIDYVEIDASVLALVKSSYEKTELAKITFHAGDGRKFIQRTQNIYDVIIVDVPDPQNAQLNRYYTVDFFREVSRALPRNGVLAFSLSGSENYNNRESRLLSSSIHQSLGNIFDHRLIIPGSRNIFLASNSPLSYAIATRLTERNITTNFINEAYLKARLTGDRIAQVATMVSDRAAINQDFAPVSYLAQIRYWLSHFQENFLGPIIFIGGLLCAAVFLIVKSRHRSVAAAVGASGFAGMGLEIILLFAFQSFYGNVYQQIGIIFSAFLIGTALGALAAMKIRVAPRPFMVKLDVLLAVIALALPFMLVFIQHYVGTLESLCAWVIFPALVLSIGFVVGGQFQTAARIMAGSIAETAANLYTLDFLGSALGALVVGAFIVPLLGMKTTCFLVGILKIATATQLAFAKEGTDPLRQPLRIDPISRNLALLILTFLGLGLLVASDRTGLHLYAISFAPAYHWLLLFLLAWGIIQAVGRDHISYLPGRLFCQQTPGMSPGRMFSYLAYSLVIFFPIFRCYFKIPYLFCHVCPRPCVFGYMRPYLIPAALIMNIEKRHWCFKICPLGTLQDCQFQKARQHFFLPRAVGILPLIVLGCTTVWYFLVKTHAGHPEAPGINWYNGVYKNIFSAEPLVLLIGGVLLLMAFYCQRPFCELLCPVGTFAKLVLKIEKIGAGKRG